MTTATKNAACLGLLRCKPLSQSVINDIHVSIRSNQLINQYTHIYVDSNSQAICAQRIRGYLKRYALRYTFYLLTYLLVPKHLYGVVR